MNIQDLRQIQASGTSHDAIDAIITFLEERDHPIKTTLPKKVVKKVSKKKK